MTTISRRTLLSVGLKSVAATALFNVPGCHPAVAAGLSDEYCQRTVERLDKAIGNRCQFYPAGVGMNLTEQQLNALLKLHADNVRVFGNERQARSFQKKKVLPGGSGYTGR